MPDSINQDIAIHGEGNIVVGQGNVVINPLPPAEARLRTDLGILLKNVQNTWIKGVLEKSIHEAALLELGMEIREDSIDNPWHMVLEKPDQTREVLPRGRKIKDIFDEANRLLLILGEPGSGKTTTLLQLARDLIAEVDQSFTHPVPVILNLSTWTNKQQPLDEWLVTELNSKYLLPKKQGKLWLQERRILPLLDGLDEVKAENRAACVERINRLIVDYGLQGLVVCSRIKDYTDLNVRLAFYRAIYLQPLTHEQIDEYLVNAGAKLINLRLTLQADKTLKNMAQSPLILSIMSLAYQNTSAEALSDSTLNTDKARSKHLFDTYIARMFSRKAGPKHFDSQQTKRRLSWLANNMRQHNTDIFQIEDLQPSWLSTSLPQWSYVLMSRLSFGLIFSSLVWLIAAMPDGEIGFPTLFQILVVAMVIGFGAGLPVGVIDLLRFKWLRKHPNLRIYSTIWWPIVNVIVVCIASGAVFGLELLIIGAYLDNIPTLGDIIGVGSFLGFFPALFGGIRNSHRNIENDIQTTEVLHWSWSHVLKGFSVFGTLGFGLFLVIELRTHEFGKELVMLFGLIAGIAGGIYGGLRGGIMDTKSFPNQGMQLSIRNAIRSSLTVGLIGGSVSIILMFTIIIFEAIFMGEPMPDFAEIDYVGLSFFATLIGSILGVIGLLWFGVLDVIQHYTLRLILVIQGRTQWNYACFLDYATDHVFLQKVGGGYRFIHRLLLEHFADMYEQRL